MTVSQKSIPLMHLHWIQFGWNRFGWGGEGMYAGWIAIRRLSRKSRGDMRNRPSNLMRLEVPSASGITRKGFNDRYASENSRRQAEIFQGGKGRRASKRSVNQWAATYAGSQNWKILSLLKEFLATKKKICITCSWSTCKTCGYKHLRLCICYVVEMWSL